MDDPVSIPFGRADRGSFLVDAADAEWVRQWTWSLGTRGYVVRQTRAAEPRFPKNVYLHRELMGLGPGDEAQKCDHINRDPRDNRRSNLRLVDDATNAQNKNARGGSSHFRGVSWDRSKGRWLAQARLNGRHFFLGRFDSEEQAARVASEWRRQHMPFSTETPIP